MSNVQLLIALSICASPQEIEEAHASIDNFYAKTAAPVASAAVTPQQIAAETSEATAETSDATVDKDGLPWDERIHSSNHGLNKDGTWRKRKGVDASLVAKVERELKATVAAAPVAAAPVAASLPPMPGAGLPPMPGAAVDPTYSELVQVVTTNMQSELNPTGRITADWLKQVLTHYGIAEGSLQNAAHNLDAAKQALDFIKSAL